MAFSIKFHLIYSFRGGNFNQFSNNSLKSVNNSHFSSDKHPCKSHTSIYYGTKQLLTVRPSMNFSKDFRYGNSVDLVEDASLHLPFHSFFTNLCKLLRSISTVATGKQVNSCLLPLLMETPPATRHNKIRFPSHLLQRLFVDHRAKSELLQHPHFN